MYFFCGSYMNGNNPRIAGYLQVQVHQGVKYPVFGERTIDRIANAA